MHNTTVSMDKVGGAQAWRTASATAVLAPCIGQQTAAADPVLSERAIHAVIHRIVERGAWLPIPGKQSRAAQL
jgi:hypothetical protein